MRQCYQREKYYPLGKSCRVGGETFSRSRCQSAHDLHWRLSDTSSLFRCGINEARPRGVEKNHFKTSHQLNVISRDCIIRNQCWNWGRGGGGGIDWSLKCCEDGWTLTALYRTINAFRWNFLKSDAACRSFEIFSGQLTGKGKHMSQHITPCLFFSLNARRICVFATSQARVPPAQWPG